MDRGLVPGVGSDHAKVDCEYSELNRVHSRRRDSLTNVAADKHFSDAASRNAGSVLAAE
jgi:hypothetical protein